MSSSEKVRDIIETSDNTSIDKITERGRKIRNILI